MTTSTDETRTPACSLNDPQIKCVLERLHANARGDLMRFPKMILSEVFDRLIGRNLTTAERAQRTKDIYIPVSPEKGLFLYLVARSIKATRIVEFGTSFGISTIYLAAAVKDNGGGLVIGSEIEETKVAAARQNLVDTGLQDYVEIRVGDALETLADPGATVDMVLMDGWKNHYMPIIKMLTPYLRANAVVLSDNIKTFKKSLAPYVAHMENMANGFQSLTLPLGDGLQYSVRLPDNIV